MVSSAHDAVVDVAKHAPARPEAAATAATVLALRATAARAAEGRARRIGIARENMVTTGRGDSYKLRKQGPELKRRQQQTRQAQQGGGVEMR